MINDLNVKNELQEFKNMTEKFYNKEVSVKEYKGFSGRFGSYAQKGAQKSMLRLRMTGGRLTKDKLKFIADEIKTYNIDKIHATTCQTIQLHNLDGKTVCELIEKAIENGIDTRGGGGDFPRNVMASPLSGVQAEENFDVLPYAEAASEYLMSLLDKVKLPRKLKVCFSNSDKNETHATFRDLGFVSKSNGKFDVYSAGGLGNNPKMGVLVCEDVEPDKILYYIKAMVDTFTAYGNYENRAKARTRYMQESLGVEEYKKAYNEKLQHVMSNEKLDITIKPINITKTGKVVSVNDKRIIPQKQDGLYTVSYHPIGGNINPEKLIQIYDTIKDMESVELRIAPHQTIYIINCDGDEIKKVLDVTNDGANTQFEASVSCIGASICQVGLRNSQGLLKLLVEAVKPYDFEDGVLPLIHISGCTSSCGTHQIGQIGFHGSVKMIDKKPVSAFSVHVFGYDEQGEEQFGEQVGIIAEDDIPKLMIEIGQTVQKSGTKYDTWILEHKSDLIEIVKKYI